MLRQTTAAPAALAAQARRAVALVVLTVLADLAVGLPGCLVLAGGWALAAGTARLLPRLAGTASWAAGTILEMGLVSGLSLLLALVSPHPHGTLTNLVLLLLPVLAGLAMLGVGIRRDARPALPGHPGIAALVTGAGLALAAWIASRGTSYGIAWVMSGDGRNHALILRKIISEGGITLGHLQTYPLVVNAFSAVLSSAGGRSGLAPGRLLVHDAQAMASTYVLAAVALSVLFVAALVEVLPESTQRRRLLPTGVVVAVLAAASMSVTGLVLGTSLLDGFFSSYGGLPVALAGVVIALRTATAPSAWGLVLLGASIMLTLFAWTVMVVVPVGAAVAACLVTAYRLRDRISGATTRRRWQWAAGVACGPGAVVVSLGVWLTQWGTLKKQFLVPGPNPTPIQHWLLYLLGLVALGLAATARNGRLGVQLAAPAASAALGVVTIAWMRSLTPANDGWTYYSAKALWTVAACLVWVLFVPIVRAADARPRGATLHAAEAVRAAALSLAVLVGLTFTTAVPGPLHSAADGWQQPSADVITETAVLADKGKPFVLWDWTYPGDDRLGDFWATLAWGSTPSGDATSTPTFPIGLYNWAYTDAGQITSLCEIATGVPGLTVATRDPKVKARLAKACPKAKPHILLAPPKAP